MQSFRKSLELYEKAGRYFDPPLKRIEIRYGDKIIPAYLRLRHDGKKHPVIINVGGIDGFKAEAFEYEEAMHRGGLSTCALDMPGVGESPIKASTDSESLFSAVIDYLSMSPEIDAQRIGMLGRSFGGYWSAKMALAEAQRLRASVVWGGGVHYFFQEDWLRHSTNAESYLMDHDVARCAAFGVDTIDKLASVFPSMSLKDQGWLDKPSCRMLLVNGKDDVQTPIVDLYILLETVAQNGSCVSRRAHGSDSTNLADIVDWLQNALS